mgnify:CR=1 FL=1
MKKLTVLGLALALAGLVTGCGTTGKTLAPALVKIAVQTGTTYGIMLAAKIVLTGILLFFGMLNLKIVRAVRRGWAIRPPRCRSCMTAVKPCSPATRRDSCAAWSPRAL